MNIYFRLSFAAATIGFYCLAQTPMMQFHHYTIGDGLSQNTILAASQDSAGFLWFGTADGLNRFDGYRFKVFRNKPFDSTSLSAGDISSIVHDEAGRCWVGTIQGGLNLLDSETDRFTRFHHIENEAQSLCDDSVNVLYLDSRILWIGTEHGLDRMEIPVEEPEGPLKDWIQDIRFQHVTVSQDSNRKNLSITCIFRDDYGYLWTGTNNGLFVAPPESLHFFKFSPSKTRPGSQGSRTIRCIFQDSRRQIWVGTNYGGLNLLVLPDSASGLTRFQRIQGAAFRRWMPESGNGNSSISSDVVCSIVESSPGVLWIGTENGLNRFEQATERFAHYRHDPDNVFSLSNNTVWQVMRDRSGLFWIGTDGGLNTFHENQHQFQKFQHHPGDSRSLSNAYVWTIAEDSAGDLWIGTSSGLNQFNPGTQTLTGYLHIPGNEQSLGSNAILSSIIDHDGMLWLGLNGPGLDRALIRPGKPVSFIHMDRSPGELGSQTILTLYEDGDHALWIGTWNNGLEKILPHVRQSLMHSAETKVPFIRFYHDPKNPDSISPNRIYAICQDRTGALWIGTEGDGINVLSENHRRVKDPAHEPVRFVHFRHDPGDPESLSHNVVMCIYEDRRGNLWFGTYGGGLNLFHRDRYKFSHFTVNEGLPNNIVYGIQEDKQGFLWLSTNHGLSKFNPQTFEFHNFTVHDGLQDYEFNSGAVYRTKDGHLVFGGINGFNYFSPESIYLNPHVPPVVISEFKVDNKPIIVIPGRPVRLSHKQNLISIEFSALNYIYSEKNRYRYRLDPIDKAWIESDTERKATYTHLAPRSYLFHVQGSNNDGVWNREGATLYIQIDPPFWLAIWFRVLVLGIFLGIIYTIHYVRTRSIQNLNRLLEARVRERTEALRLSNSELHNAMENVKALEGLLPICASCKKVRDDKGYWHQVDVYIRDHSQVKFTHGLCPECYEKYDKEI